MEELGHHNSVGEVSMDVAFGLGEGDGVHGLVYFLELLLG